MHFYKQQISEIEQFLKTPTAADIYSPQALQEVLRTQYRLFISLSARLAEVHRELADLMEQANFASNSRDFEVRSVYDKSPRKEKRKVCVIVSLFFSLSVCVPQ